jgi:hypothetical protein
MLDTRDYICGLPLSQPLDAKATSFVVRRLALNVFRRLIPTGLDKGFLALRRRLLPPFRSPHKPTETKP